MKKISVFRKMNSNLFSILYIILIQIILNNDTLEQVDEYKCLENMITEDGRSTREIINRINRTK